MSAMMYDLFDLTTMNAIDWFNSLNEALLSIRETIDQCGTDAVETWVLVPQDRDEPPIRGQELVDRARSAISV